MSTPEGPGRIDVIVHTEPAWWQIVAAVGPVVVLLGVAAIALGCWLLRPVSGRDADDAVVNTFGWDRVKWAMDAAVSSDPKRRKAGLALLEQLSVSRCLDEESIRIATQVRKLLDKD